MKVFVAGGSGVLGRFLVPKLVANGHAVTASTTSPDKIRLLEELGATGVVMDGWGTGVHRRRTTADRFGPGQSGAGTPSASSAAASSGWSWAASWYAAGRGPE